MGFALHDPHTAMYRTLRPPLIALSLLHSLFLFLSVAEAPAQGIEGLGFDVVSSVSHDGSAVVGRSGSGEGFLWREGENLLSLGADMAPRDVTVTGAGSTVVIGLDWTSGAYTPFVWQNGAITTLDYGDQNDEFNYWGGAFGISADGSIIVGHSAEWIDTGDPTDPDILSAPTRWVGGVRSLLDDFPGHAAAVSADGSVVAGEQQDGGSYYLVRWSQSGGEILGSGFASAVSFDGTTIVGVDWSSGSPRALLYRGASLEVLGDGIPKSVSGNGSVVVGTNSSQTAAILWTEADGIRDLAVVLEQDYGMDLEGWILTDASDISADGTVIVGRGQNPGGFAEAWRVVLCGTVAEWNDPAGGAFDDEQNWLDLAVPDSATTARFDSGDAYIVTFAGDAGNNRLEVSGGVDVAFGLGSNTHTLSGVCADETVEVDGARLSVRAGTLRSEKNAVLTGTEAEPGELFVRGSGARLEADSALFVGDAGHGLLRVEETAETFAYEALVGSGPGGRGTVEVEGGSRLVVESTLSLALVEGAEGDVLVTGEGSELVLNSYGSVGSTGIGTARVASSGRLLFEDPALGLDIGTDATGDGSLEVESRGIVVGEFLTVGVEGSAQVTITGEGTIQVTNLEAAVEPESQGLLDIQGGGGEGALLNVRGVARIGVEGTATLRVTATGFVFGTDDDGPAGRFVFGAESGGVGSLEVGDDGVVGAMREMVVGERGTGVMSVLGPESLVSVGTLRVGGSDAGAGGSGLVSVGGTGSRLEAELIVLGRGGSGILLALPGGTVEASGIVVYGNGLQELGGTIDAATIVVQPAFEPRTEAEAQAVALEHTGSVRTGSVRTDTLLVFGEGAGIAADALTVLGGGIVGGTGPFPFGFTNAGTISPADTASATATFAVAGDLVQVAGGVLEVELGGTAEGEHDRLAATGTAMLGGTLRLVLRPDYVPEVGDEYEVVTAASVEGSFEAVEMPPDVALVLSYTAAGVVATVTGVTLDAEGGPDPAAVPQETVLLAPYPNPVAGRATVTFEVPEAGPVRLVVYDVLGREVAVLAEGSVEAGRHEAVLDAVAFPSGTYVIQLTASGPVQAQRVTVVR